jgi:hypothetical protein
MIWAVKILALNKKDGKGNDLIFMTKKSLPTKIWPEQKKRNIFRPLMWFYLGRNCLL